MNVPVCEREPVCVVVKDGVPDKVRVGEGEHVDERVRDGDGVRVALPVIVPLMLTVGEVVRKFVGNGV